MSAAKKKKPSRKPYRFEITRLGLVGWCFGLFLALLWMFFLGVFVGKGITPANISLTRIKKKMMSEGVWPGSGGSQQDETAAQSVQRQKEISLKDLEFYEELNKKKRARLQGHAKAEQSPQQRRSGRVAAQTPAQQAPTTPEQRGQSPGHFTVQVASFRDLASAESLEARLKDLKLEAVVVSVELPGKGRWYRVRVGRLSSREDAAALARRLSSSYHLQSLVVRLAE